MDNTAQVTIDIAARNAASATLKQVESDLASMGGTMGAVAKQTQLAGVAFSGMSGTLGDRARGVVGTTEAAAVSTGRLNVLMDKLSFSSNEGVGRMRMLTSQMAFMGLSAVGAEGHLGKLGEGLLMFGGGHVAVLALAAALIGIGFAMKAMGDGSEEARKKLEDLEKQTHKTFEGSLPEYEKYTQAHAKLQKGVDDARAALARAQIGIEGHRWAAERAMGTINEYADANVAKFKHSIEEAAKAQDDLNKALLALHEVRAVFIQHQQQQVDQYRVEAEAVGKSAEQVLRLRLEHEHFDPVLEQEALRYARLKDQREAQLALDKYYLSLSPDDNLKLRGLPGDSELQRAERFIKQQEEVMKQRAEAFKAFDEMQAKLRRGEGPIQTSDGATGEGAFPPPIPPERLTGIKAIAKGFLDAAGNAQILNFTIAQMATQTLTALGDAFTNAFQAAFDGTQNVAKAFAGAMLTAIKDIAKHLGMLALADAVKALAHGILGDPRGFAAAGKFALAAGMYFALAGAAGALAGGGGGGGGVGASGGLSSASVTQQATAPKPTTTVVLQGDIWNVSDPAFIDNIASVIINATGRDVIMKRG